MSCYDREWVAKYYDEYGEKEWDRLVRSPSDEVSLHIHEHYLKHAVAPGSHVLEIGAGAGRFTQMLGRLDCRVLVADISEVQLDLNRKYAVEHGFEAAVEDRRLLDVCDLSSLDDGSFDAVVCYGGPLSYVFEKAWDALGECRRVLVDGGILLASVMSIWGSVHRYLEGVMRVPTIENMRITTTGNLSPAQSEHISHFCHMYRASEFKALLQGTGFKPLALSASCSLASHWDEFLTGIRDDAEKWNELLRMEIEASSEEGCLDMGEHLIAVARKAQAPVTEACGCAESTGCGPTHRKG
jgi:SAM-dependent methyltransferase